MWGLLIKILIVLFLIEFIVLPIVVGNYNAIRASYWWMRP